MVIELVLSAHSSLLNLIFKWLGDNSAGWDDRAMSRFAAAIKWLSGGREYIPILRAGFREDSYDHTTTSEFI